MAVNGSAASGRFVGAELVIDPIGTAFEPLEHSPAPFRSHLISGECIGDFVMSMLDWNGYRQQVLSGVGALGKLSPDTERIRHSRRCLSEDRPARCQDPGIGRACRGNQPVLRLLHSRSYP